MATAVLKEQLQATCGEVDRACELLTSPSAESLDRCSQILEMAGRRLAESEARWGGGDVAVMEGAQRLWTSVRRAARLLDGAARFHLNWSRLRGAMTGGYTERGDPAPVSRGSRISIRG